VPLLPQPKKQIHVMDGIALKLSVLLKTIDVIINVYVFLLEPSIPILIKFLHQFLVVHIDFCRHPSDL
jgi:hypothetical protein